MINTQNIRNWLQLYFHPKVKNVEVQNFVCMDSYEARTKKPSD